MLFNGLGLGRSAASVLLLGGSLVLACGSSSGDASIPDGGSATEDAGGNDGGPPMTPGSDSGTADADAATDASSAPACATLPFPAACTAAATTVPPAGSFGADGTFAVTVETLAAAVPGAPLAGTVYLPAGQTNVPVVFVSHAFGATKVAAYDALLRNLASRGIAAVYAPYATLSVTNAERYTHLWQGFLAATTTYAAIFDLTRVGFIGHSFGGGATPEMARRGFVEMGWGSAGRFMFVMAPWYSWGSGYDTLPTDVRAVIQVYADDDTNDHQIAVEDIWKKLPAGIERRWLLIRSDACQCGLNADHVVPTSASQTNTTPGSRLDGNDLWGVHRRIDALAKYAFSGDVAARAIAYGEDTDMGKWIGCGGRSVRPLEAASVPITTTCQALVYPLAKRCASADPGVACP